MEGSVCEKQKMAADSPEESSWTFYIEGFICEDNNNSCFSSETDHESPSLLSDAASSAVAKNKLLMNNCNWTQPPQGLISSNKSIKKQKTNFILAMDTDLEDTASSPVNSPKVSYMNQFMNHDVKKEKAKMDVSEVKRKSFGKVFTVERDSNYADLKKRSNCG